MKKELDLTTMIDAKSDYEDADFVVIVVPKAYGIMAVGKAILDVLETGTEVRGLIEESVCGKCCELE
ncbi:MAG: hypothetical protein ACLT5Z_00525 [Eisenbergiella sp.]